MTKIYSNLTELIGNTPLLELGIIIIGMDLMPKSSQNWSILTRLAV